MNLISDGGTLKTKVKNNRNSLTRSTNCAKPLVKKKYYVKKH